MTKSSFSEAVWQGLLPIYVPLFCLGSNVHLVTAGMWAIINFAVFSYGHSGLDFGITLLEFFIFVPSSTDHANHYLFRNKNFGGLLDIWDLILKTKHVQIKTVDS